MLCSKCGKENSENARFCSNCGVSLLAEKKEQSFEESFEAFKKSYEKAEKALEAIEDEKYKNSPQEIEIAEFSASYWPKLGLWGHIKSSKDILTLRIKITNKKMIWAETALTTYLGIEKEEPFIFPYEKITKIELCTFGLFPTGVKIYTNNNGEYKLGFAAFGKSTRKNFLKCISPFISKNAMDHINL